jgi:hypothetical protein
MQTHLALRALSGTEKPDKDVQVLFAVQPNRRGLLFIHGFSGDAINTWSDFHLLLPDCETCVGRDLFFYGYDGLRAEMTASASLFRNFLDRLFCRTAAFVNGSLPVAAHRPADFTYDELVIVAHSLGAVITRRALLDATRLGVSWVSKIKLVLYAPAHRGACVAALALETATSFRFLRFFGALARFESPLIDQLKPDSADLRRLLEETERAREGGANPHLVARRVVIAEYEKIVRNESFGEDPPPETIPDTTHMSVCKPRQDFRRPLEHLEQCL